MSVWRSLFTKVDVWGVVAFGLPLAAYVATLAPSLYVRDSSEFITAAATLGVPHPPGYPLYVLLGKLATFLPFGSVPWRVNLLSGIGGAGAVYFTYLVVRHLTKLRPLALVAALTLAFSTTFWSQSVVAGHYSLYALFALTTFYFLLKWGETGQRSFWYAVMVLVGLGTGVHQLMVLLLPVYLAFAAFTDPRLLRDWHVTLRSALFFFAGCSVYGVLPLLSRAHPALNWGNIHTWTSFWQHVSRAQYADFGKLAVASGKLGLVTDFFQSWPSEFGWIVVLAALLGLLISWRDWRVGTLLLGTWFTQSVLIVFLRNYSWGLDVAYVYRVYYIVAYAIVVVYAAMGTAWLYHWVILKWPEVRSRRLWLGVFATTVLCSVPLALWAEHRSATDLSRQHLIYDVAHEQLASLPPRAVLLVKQTDWVIDTELFSFFYVQFVEHLRPDVTLLEDTSATMLPADFSHFSPAYDKLPFLAQRREFLDLAWQYADRAHRPLFTTFPVENVSPNLHSRAWGFSYQVFATEASARGALVHAASLPPSFKPTDLGHVDRLLAPSLAHYLYLQAAVPLEQGKLPASQGLLLLAIRFDAEAPSQEYLDYVAHRSWWLGHP